ncbi:MAG: MFS transporter [Halanaerobiales bacterium]|nr:MFS transporter [Halanaerobiales bacterium]
MSQKLKKSEINFLVGIASALGLRQFSLILAMPLLAVYGNTLQGSGAIMAVAYSWIGDVISETKRNEAMSIVGIAFGLAGTVGFIGATLLNKVFSVSQIFLFCAIFTIFCLLFFSKCFHYSSTTSR